MKNKLVLCLIVIVALCASLMTGATSAQDLVGLPEGPGRTSGDVSAPPPDRDTAPLSWAFSGGSNYDSGWIDLGTNEAKTLSHNLGGDTDNYVVDMQYRNSGSSEVNQRYYGGADLAPIRLVG